MAEMIATLSDACEREFGFLAARLFRVFKNDEVQGNVTDFGFRCQSSNDFSASTQSHQTCYYDLKEAHVFSYKLGLLSVSGGQVKLRMCTVHFLSVKQKCKEVKSIPV